MRSDATRKSALQVLVVDDDPAIRRMCRALLEPEGWGIHEAADGEEALSIAGLQVLDLIIMDASMPHLDGLEATRRLRANPETADIPIIMLSARTDSADVQAGLDAGADDYLAKPLQPDKLHLLTRLLSRLRRAKVELQGSYGTLGEQARCLSLLLDLSWGLSQADELDPILARSLEMAATLTTCRRSAILLPSSPGGELQVTASVGFGDAVSKGVPVRLDATISGITFTSSEAIVANTTREAAELQDAADWLFFEKAPFASVPMRAEGRTIGVLNVSSRITGRAFSARDLEYLSLVCNNAAAAIDGVLTRRSRDEAYSSVVIALAKLAEFRDDGTGKHLDRVTQFCLTLARTLRRYPEFAPVISGQFLQDLQLAAPLHDIGKVAIPDSVLLKPDRLSESEMAVMRTHVIVGVEAIESVLARAPGARFLQMAREMIGFHHERYDGSGYPDCLQGADIPLPARLLAVADVYDALTTKRVYKELIPHTKAVEIIAQQSGKHFDPMIVAAFLQCAEEFERLSNQLSEVAPASTGEATAELQEVSLDTSPSGQARFLPTTQCRS